jgi:predicted anti-sigma-YlaC factor YlaD
MNNHEIKNSILFYIEGSLNESESKKIAEHIENCDHCRNLYQRLCRTIQVIDQHKNVLPDTFIYTRIISKMERTDKKNAYYRYKILQPIIIGLIALISIFGGMQLGSTYKKTLESNTSNTESYLWNDLSQETIENTLLASE